MMVDVNEATLVHSLLHKVSKACPDWSKPHPIIDNFFVRDLILTNVYREHNAKNYDDKIFFFEPINKYFDLLWFKRMAFEVFNARLNDSAREKVALKEWLAQAEKQSAAPKKDGTAHPIIAETSVQFEPKAQRAMVTRLLGQKVDLKSLETASESFLNFL